MNPPARNVVMTDMRIGGRCAPSMHSRREQGAATVRGRQWLNEFPLGCSRMREASKKSIPRPPGNQEKTQENSTQLGTPAEIASGERCSCCRSHVSTFESYLTRALSC